MQTLMVTIFMVALLHQTGAQGVGCASQPCLNGCTCQPSCRDENDYVCVPQPGHPFVGKNCNWRAEVICGPESTISIRVPEMAVAEYAIGVNTVVVQGCSSSPFFLCNDQPTCGPVTQSVNGFFDLTCRQRPSSFNSATGEVIYSETFVFDRLSSIISMPRPIIKVDCTVRTIPAIGRVTPEFRVENTVTSSIVWQPIFNFFKTPWTVVPVIPATRVEGTQTVNYIIGERIHVQMTAGSNMNTGEVHSITLGDCFVQPVQDGAANATPRIKIISNGMVVPTPEFPVSVALANGQIGGGLAPSQQGVAFNFQVFTFGVRMEIKLTCSASIDGIGSRGRRSDNEYKFKQYLRFIPVASETDPDIPVLEMRAINPEVTDVIKEALEDFFDHFKNTTVTTVEEDIEYDVYPDVGEAMFWEESDETLLTHELGNAEVFLSSVPIWAKFASIGLLFLITIMLIIVLRQRRLMLIMKMSSDYANLDNKSLLS